MSFEGILRERSAERGFGSAACVLSSKKRPHISRSKIEETGNVQYLDVGDFGATRYTGDL